MCYDDRQWPIRAGYVYRHCSLCDEAVCPGASAVVHYSGRGSVQPGSYAEARREWTREHQSPPGQSLPHVLDRPYREQLLEAYYVRLGLAAPEECSHAVAVVQQRNTLHVARQYPDRTRVLRWEQARDNL